MANQQQDDGGTKAGTTVQPGDDVSVRLRIYAWWVGIAAVIFVLLFQAWQIRSLRKEVEEVRTAAEAELVAARDEMAKARVVAAAEAFASGVEPLMYLRNRGGEITDETLRQVVTSLGQTGGFSLVVVVDAAGMIVATTDTTLRLGSRFPAYKGPGPREEKTAAGKWEVQRPVSSAGDLGSVVLVDR